MYKSKSKSYRCLPPRDSNSISIQSLCTFNKWVQKCVKITFVGWEYSVVVEYLLSMCRALSSIPNDTKTKTFNQTHLFVVRKKFA